MIDQAIAAMLDYLGEDYSTYMNQDETADLENHLSGQYVGIGISITNGNQIVKVYEDTPASRVGLEDNDVITSINGTSTEGLNQNAVSALISKTEENTIVINRGGQTHTFKVKAETLNSPLISEIFEENNKRIGYILIESFTNTVEEEFAQLANTISVVELCTSFAPREQFFLVLGRIFHQPYDIVNGVDVVSGGGFFIIFESSSGKGFGCLASLDKLAYLSIGR